MRYTAAMTIKMYIVIKIDEKEYQMPADGNVGEELLKAVTEYLYDIEGIEVKNIRSVSE